jgi:protease-4
MQTSVNAIYGRFLGIVAASRHKTPQQIDQIAQGRVWDGGTARQIGLVDGFGGIDDAIAKAAQLAKLGDERHVRYLEPRPSFKQQLIESLASERNDDDSAGQQDAFAAIAGQPQQQLAAAIAEVRSILSGPSIQARCMECGAVAPARTTKAGVGFLELIKTLLS